MFSVAGRAVMVAYVSFSLPVVTLAVKHSHLVLLTVKAVASCTSGPVGLREDKKARNVVRE